MWNFLLETFSGLASGEVAQTSAACFDLAFLVFVLATVAYLVYLAVRRDVFWRIGIVCGVIAAVSMTLALALRWIAAGWAHPPFTNLYESLVFFTWGIIVFYLFVEWRFKIKIAGAFVIPLACLTMGLASLSPEKGIEPLVPALQSIWLHLHVMVASIAYAAFLASFAFAVLYFLRDRLQFEWFIAAISGFAVCALPAASKGALFHGAFVLDKVVLRGGEWLKVEMPGRENVFEQIALPGVGPFLLIALAGFLAALVMAIHAVWPGTSCAMRSNSPQPNGRAPVCGYTLSVFAASFVFLTAGLILFFIQLARLPEARLASNPYAFAMLLVVWLGALVVLIAQWRYELLLAALPEVKAIDRLTYKTIMVGFPLMTLVIITGAIWANKAWGRYWGWDPKETASLVTWIIYLLFLHTRLTQGWIGRRSMLIAVIGFASVVFTYLGVNLLLPGLHAYATG